MPIAGCAVTVRYLYQVLRGLPKEQVFAQIVLGFELAQTDPRFVGLNLVMPEDWYVPMHDFDLHMKMLDYLHGIYPKVHISLHAGELAMGLVPPEGLAFHIRESIETRPRRAHRARRQRHERTRRHRPASRDGPAQSAGGNLPDLERPDSRSARTQHPLPAYMRYGVPVALATDDQGVSRSDMTHEYLRAAETYNLSYADLKRMARQSLEYSFLNTSDRAQARKKLEQAFTSFEKNY